MKEILEIVLKLLEKDQNYFTELKKLEIFADGSVQITHEAQNPKRTIDIDFEKIKDAISYVKSL